MTEFKPGDRVRYTSENPASRGPWSSGSAGTVVGPWGEVTGGSLITWDYSDRVCRHFNENLELIEPPNAFKPGDRVTVRLGIHEFNKYETGVVREVRPAVDGHPQHLVLENGHWGYAKNAVHFEPAQSTRPLVGPAPKVEAPVFVAPFKAFGGILARVEDAAGNTVLDVAYGTEDAQSEFAAYVAAALNARVAEEN